MMNFEDKWQAEQLVAANKEEWQRLLFLIMHADEANVFWINSDTTLASSLLRQYLSNILPHQKAISVVLTEDTISLYWTIAHLPEEVNKDAIIHVSGLDTAIHQPDFIRNLNMERELLFEQLPTNIIIWGNAATAALLHRRAYDFWSWMFLEFSFKTPKQTLTERQRGYQEIIAVGKDNIAIPGKDSLERIRHLEQEWEDLTKLINNKPETEAQMNDLADLASALHKEYTDEGQYQKAAHMLEYIISMDINKLSKRRLSIFHNNLGLCYINLGNPLKAKNLLQKALKQNIRIFGSTDSVVIKTKSNLAIAYSNLEELERAKDLLLTVLASNIKKFGKGHAEVAITQSDLAIIYRGIGDFKKAEVLLEQALITDTKNLGKEHPTIARGWSNLAVVYLDLGMLDKARGLLQKALKSNIKNFSEEHINVATVHNNLSVLLHSINEEEAALIHMKAAYRIRDKFLGSEHPRTQDSLEALNQIEAKIAQSAVQKG